MYGDKRDYKKINFYDKKTGKYLASTTWARTCKEALQHFTNSPALFTLDNPFNKVTASYK